jgi:hypothetical protein
MTSSDLHDRSLIQLHDAIEHQTAAALATVQALIATCPLCDPALATVELDLIGVSLAVDRAQVLVRHATQVMSGLRLPSNVEGV